MDFLLFQVEIDILEDRNAFVFLCYTLHLENYSHSIYLFLIRSIGYDATMPSPLTAINNLPLCSMQLVIPCLDPSALLCKLPTGWKLLSNRITKPYDLAGAHGFIIPNCLTPPACSGSRNDLLLRKVGQTQKSGSMFSIMSLQYLLSRNTNSTNWLRGANAVSQMPSS